VYFDPEARELVEEEQSGHVEGIGALVTAEDSATGELCSVISDTCRMSIVSTIGGTPAEAAGLQPDDAVVAVNGEDIRNWTLDEVTATVRGPAGSDVVLTLERGEEVFDVTITRAEFVVPVVSGEVIDATGYIALNTFTDNADELFERELEVLLDQGVDTLVFDLRNNPGGLLDTAIEVASAFLPDGDVVVTKSPDSSTSYPVSGDPIGKNTVQQRFSLSNGGALKLTIARWLTPGGLDFGSVGVTPDVLSEIEIGLPIDAVVREALAALVTVATP
jgi:carboxyl-terminal processing protease